MPKGTKIKPTYLPVVKVINQRYDTDCGVAALAMFTGKSYEDVLHAYGAPVHRTGVNMNDIVAAADKLGVKMSLRRRVRLEEDYGILGVKTPLREHGEHVVVLYEGLIFDTDGTVWEVDDYLKSESGGSKEQAKPTSIIKIDHRKRR